MKREELDTLLEELTHEDLTTERQLEIFKAIQDDKDKSINDFNELNDKTNALQDEFTSLKKKKVDEFFHKGTYEPEMKKQFENGTEDKVTYDTLLEEK